MGEPFLDIVRDGQKLPTPTSPSPHRSITRTEAPVRGSQLNGAEECYEKHLKRFELRVLSHVHQSRQQCDAPQGILTHITCSSRLNSGVHSEKNPH